MSPHLLTVTESPCQQAWFSSHQHDPVLHMLDTFPCRALFLKHPFPIFRCMSHQKSTRASVSALFIKWGLSWGPTVQRSAALHTSLCTASPLADHIDCSQPMLSGSFYCNLRPGGCIRSPLYPLLRPTAQTMSHPEVLDAAALWSV